MSEIFASLLAPLQNLVTYLVKIGKIKNWLIEKLAFRELTQVGWLCARASLALE